MFHSIKTKLLGVILASFLVTIFLLITLNVNLVKNNIKEQSELQFAQELSIIFHNLEKRYKKLEASGLSLLVEDSYKQQIVKELRELYYDNDRVVVYPLILDNQGRVVMHPSVKAGALDFRESDLAVKMGAAPQGDFSYFWEGKEYWIEYKTFAPWGWKVGYQISHRDKFQVIYSVIWGDIAISWISFALFFSVILFMLNRIVNPLLRFADDAEIIGKGDWGHSIKLMNTNDELGRLSVSFSGMLRQVRLREVEREELIQEITKKNDALQSQNLQIIESENKIRCMNADLEERVKQRTEELEKAQAEALDNAQKAGMAIIATEVIHNVGNVLNSVITSGDSLSKELNESSVPRLVKATELLEQHLDSLDTFIAEDPKGKKLMHFYVSLTAALKTEHASLCDKKQRLLGKIELIREIVQSQQCYAGGANHSEDLQISEVINNILELSDYSASLEYPKVVCKYMTDAKVVGQKTKVVQVIMNLLKNAKDAMAEIPRDEQIIEITLQGMAEMVELKISDIGCGIEAAHLETIFSHGYTTKVDGHGFGLHSCANFMTEMGGSIHATSQGLGKGATFVLKFKAAQQARVDFTAESVQASERFPIQQ